MDVSCKEDEFVREFAKQIQNKSASVFVGSGLSRASGYVDWKGLLREVALDIGLDVDKEHDLISLAEYYINSKLNRTKINAAISQFFGEEKIPTNTHELLASLPITSYWTTNYDKLLEKTFEKEGLHYSVLTNDASLRKFINGNDIVIHKLHGDVDNPGEAVITKSDYDEFAFKHEIILSKLKGEMCSNSFLFLGYSFSDTDINHILSRIRLFYKNNPAKTHYCIQEKIRRECDANGQLESKEDFEYRKRKQEHHIINLQTYGIQTVLVDDYGVDIPRILKKITQIVYSKNVFISGSCEGDNENVDFSCKLAKELSAWLVKNNYKIYSGYGKNIGEAVIEGVHDGCPVTKRQVIKKFNEQVFVFPFPYRSRLDEEKRRQIYKKIRYTAISKTQIVIIINGTKKAKRKEIIADGVIEEFAIAKRLNCKIIPIAITGGAAADVWKEMKKWNISYTNSHDFLILKEGKNYEEVLDAVCSLIERFEDNQFNVN